jgi:hypothetical protein
VVSGGPAQPGTDSCDGESASTAFFSFYRGGLFEAQNDFDGFFVFDDLWVPSIFLVVVRRMVIHGLQETYLLAKYFAYLYKE